MGFGVVGVVMILGFIWYVLDGKRFGMVGFEFKLFFEI